MTPHLGYQPSLSNPRSVNFHSSFGSFVSFFLHQWKRGSQNAIPLDEEDKTTVAFHDGASKDALIRGLLSRKGVNVSVTPEVAFRYLRSKHCPDSGHCLYILSRFAIPSKENKKPLKCMSMRMTP